jgi:uncharacterized protein (TIGR02001 family)
MTGAERPWRRETANDGVRAALLICTLAAATLPATPAAAQLGGSVSLSSQLQLRGQPISDHRPVAELEIVHDSASGFYLGGSAALVASRDAGLQPFAFKQYAGFARRLSPAVAIDLGVVHNGYTEYSSISGDGSYTEAYVGVTGRNLSGHIYLSPGYFRKDEPTLYMEIDGHADVARNLQLFAHAGRLAYLNDHRSAGDRGTTTDWRIGLRRHIGPVDLEAAWTGYVEDARTYERNRRRDGALVISLAFAAF